MSAITFELTDADLLPDIPAPSAPENPCEVCGVDIPYGGRGRKPKRCEEHKRSAAPTTPRKSNTGKNDVMARQAAAALSQVNGLIATGLMLAPGPLAAFRLPMTAAAIAAADEGFTEAAYAALVTDPKLCALILKGGGASGKLALIIAYAMLAGAVVPVAITEYRAKNGGADGGSDDRS